MKSLDKILRAWRINIALRHLPESCSRVFDIGCDDGNLLDRVGTGALEKAGMDPRLAANRFDGGKKLYRGTFPDDLCTVDGCGGYDAIFALAVLEHFSEDALLRSAKVVPTLLSEGGRLIITVPHPLVDNILDVLMALRLIDGQATEEHHGFKPDDVVTYFGGELKLVKREKFQLGLNNLFVFEKRA